MALSVVQTGYINSAFSGNLGSNVTPGNTLIVAATGYNGSNGTTISSSGLLYSGSSQPGTVKLADLQSGPGGADYLSFWMIPAVAVSSSALAITMANSITGSFVGLAVVEVAGLGPSPFMDKHSITTAGATAPQDSGSTGAIGFAPEFVFGALVQDGTSGTLPGSPWSSSITAAATANTSAQYQIVTSSGGSYDYNVGAGSADWVSGIVTIAAAAAAGMPPIQQPPIYQQRIR